MTRRRPSHLVTLAGVNVSKPSTSRAAAIRSKGWWSRRLGVDLDVIRVRPAWSAP